MKSIIFIHAALLSRCDERVIQFMNLIISSGLYEEVEKIIICFVGTDPVPEKLVELANQYTKIILHRVHTNMGEFEVPTLNMLHMFSRLHDDYRVLYMHTKNVGKPINDCIEDQVEYMSHFLVTKWRTTVTHLDTHQTVGVDLRDDPVLHYSGNFWWANSKFLATLPCHMDYKNLTQYPNPLNSERHNQEFWICHDKVAENHACVWDCSISGYERHLHRYPKIVYRIDN